MAGKYLDICKHNLSIMQFHRGAKCLCLKSNASICKVTCSNIIKNRWFERICISWSVWDLVATEHV